MMPGYSAQAVDNASKPGLSCPHCHFFLREAVQTEEGLRLCRSCFKQIQSSENGTCTDCGVSLSGNVHCYPDKAVQREVLAILVYCNHVDQGCQWQGKLKEWDTHSSTCQYRGVPCTNEGCGAVLSQKSLKDHLIVCPFRLTTCQHCSTSLPFNKLEEHFQICEEFPLTCGEAQCEKQVARKDMEQHRLKDCVVETCLTCQTKVNRNSKVEIAPPVRIATTRGHQPLANSVSAPQPLPAGMTRNKSAPMPLMGLSSSPSMSLFSPGQSSDSREIVHLSDSKVNFEHHQALAGDVKKLETELESTVKSQQSISQEMKNSKRSIELLQQENTELKSELRDLKIQMSGVATMVTKLSEDLPSRDKPELNQANLAKLNNLVKSDGEKSSTIVRLKKDLSDLQHVVEGIKSQAEVGLSMVHRDGPSGRTTERDNARIRGGGTSGGHTSLGGASETRLVAMEKRVEEMAKQLTMVKVHGQELELQLQASLASTHNGSFLWRIPDVSRRRRDAVDERVTSIYSPPFYTGRNGYKMCVRAYLNGDGMGYKTHLSLFFVLMRGECDPLLKWPFEYKVSMILVDQTHRKHIVQTFKPTPESSSFQQPQTDMNVASGCPQFAKLNIFNDDSYVKNDIMFIKCIVDTTKIFHP